MTKIPDLYSVQMGTEDSDFGSTVAPTVKLMGVTDWKIKPFVESAQADEVKGSLAPGYISNLQQVHGEASLSLLLGYDDAPYWLNGLFGKATATADTEYTRAYTAPLNTYDSDLAAISIFDLVGAEASATTDAYTLSGGVLQKAVIKGETGAPLTIDLDFIGKQVEQDEQDATKTDRAVTFVMGDHVSLYIDPDTDAVGTTPIASTFFSFELTLDTKRGLVYHLGALTPDGYRDAKWTGMLKLVLEVNSTTKAYLDALLAASGVPAKVVRIKAASGVNVLQFDFNGVILKTPDIVTDKDGVATYEFELTGQYGTALGNWLSVTSVNTVSALA